MKFVFPAFQEPKDHLHLEMKMYRLFEFLNTSITGRCNTHIIFDKHILLFSYLYNHL